MMKTLTIFLLFMTSILTTASFDAIGEPKTSDFANHAGPSVSIVIEPGPSWKHTLMKIMGLFPIHTTPQIAVWVENTDGELMQTLFVTERYAAQNWRKAPGDTSDERMAARPQALPCWSHKYGAVNGIEGNVPFIDAPLPDGVTSASPKGRLEIERNIISTEGEVVICVEINNSTDFNEYYTAEAKQGDTGWSGGRFGGGQPSLVYTAKIDVSRIPEKTSFSLVGHGSPDGSDGRLHADLSHITTAREIVSAITVLPVKR